MDEDDWAAFTVIVGGILIAFLSAWVISLIINFLW